MRRRVSMIRWLMLAVLLGTPALGGWAWWSRGHRPSDALARGRAAYDRDDWEEAARLARERLKVSRDDPEGLRLLARASLRLGRKDFASTLYRRLGESALQADDLYLLGLALSRRGMYAPAIELWERALSLDPRHAETLFELARTYLGTDRLEDAARIAADLAARPGWESRAETLLGAILAAQNDAVGASAYWRRALERPRPTVRPEGVPSPIVPRTDFARVLLHAGRPDEARDQLRLIPAERSGPEVEWLLSRVALQRRDWPASRAAFERSGSYRADRPLMPDSAPFVGAARCAGCHPSEFRSQQASRHARTFHRGSELDGLDLPGAVVADPADRSVVHSWRRDAEGRVHQHTKVADRAFEAVVQYAFGAPDHSLTLVGRDRAGQAYELRLSDFPAGYGQDPAAYGQGPDAKAASHWDVTFGQKLKGLGAEEYLGRPLTEAHVRRCLGCHVTDPKAIRDGSGVCASDRGIGCERCHGPGGNHLLAVEGKLLGIDPAIARPTMASGAEVVKLCAECHSPRGQEVSRDDPVSVRFQGATLTWSRCYTQSDGALDCTTCHDPHRDASTSAAHYEARCLECHPRDERRPPPAGEGGPDRPRSRSRAARPGSPRTSCPVNPSTGCIGCHMPTVGGAVPHSRFTDHFIRVHRD